MAFDDSGIAITDLRVSKEGIRYNGNYSTTLITLDRALPDVGAVKLLRQQSNTWTTAGRPTPVAGIQGFNTTTSKFEGYNGTTWVDFH
jgi:hypothetical protein